MSATTANSFPMVLVMCMPRHFYNIIDTQKQLLLLFVWRRLNAEDPFELFFSRYDGVVVDSDEDVVAVDLGSDASIPPLDLRLYNSTEMTCMDLQYDPMTLLTRGQLATLKKQLLSEENNSGRKTNNVNTNSRSRRDLAVVDVHVETTSTRYISNMRREQLYELCQRHFRRCSE